MNRTDHVDTSPRNLDDVQAGELRTYLDRLTSSPGLATSRRGRDLLRYLVSCWLTEKDVTEFAIGLDVLGKPASFDTRIDSSVRAEMSRLRKALAAYYRDGGSGDPWRVEFPFRGYVPQVTAHRPPTMEADAIPPVHPEAPAPRKAGIRLSWPWVAVSVIAIGITGAWLIQRIGHPSVSGSSTALNAKDLYQKGHAYVARHDFYETEQAAVYLNAAIAKDPSFAPAYSDLARCYLLHVLYGNPASSLIAQAGSAAASAVRLDPASAEAHTTAGAVRAVFAWDWAGARREFRRALELDPNSVQAHEWYAVLYLLPSGDFTNALAELERARQLDPSAARLIADEGFVYGYERQYSRAIELDRRALEMDPASLTAYSHILDALWRQGNYSEWIAAQDAAPQTAVRLMANQWLKTYAEKGATAFVNSLLDWHLESERARRTSPAGGAALVALTAGRPDIAMEELEDCFPHHDFFFIYLKIDHALDSLRRDARFQELVQRVGL
jgi:tetratricopeptide (TPR) repeat protein